MSKLKASTAKAKSTLLNFLKEVKEIDLSKLQNNKNVSEPLDFSELEHNEVEKTNKLDFSELEHNEVEKTNKLDFSELEHEEDPDRDR